MSRFIAAMDHSGGSTGGVLERYGQEYTEENKMDLVHDMRLRMINSPLFDSSNIWAAIVYKDSVDKNIVDNLFYKGIETYLKVDSGCEVDGTLKEFPITDMIDYAKTNGCTGTKMRSIIKSDETIDAVLTQQFALATQISDAGLMPIVEPEVPIDNLYKKEIEVLLESALQRHLKNFKGKCILKLTLPEVNNLYHKLTKLPNVHKVVGLSGGYSTLEACARLGQQNDVTASFSRALSEGLFHTQSEADFNTRISDNIKLIIACCTNG
jgi:fructose-bisphosphate aldolase class I